MSQIQAQGGHRPAHPRIVAAVVAVAFFMQNLDGTIIATSLPQMASSFGVDAVAMGSTMTVYLLAMAVFIPLAGWLGDRFGPREVFLTAEALFVLASGACGLAPSFGLFMAARIVQGIAAAMMIPVGRMVVLAGVEKAEVVHVVSMITWPALIAPILGPVLGSLITATLDWRWNFLVNLPAGLIGIALALRFVPKGRAARRARAFDGVGFVACGLAMALLLSALELFVARPDTLALALLLAAIGAGAAAAAHGHLRRVEHPLIELDVFTIPTFALATAAAATLSRAAINAAPFLLPLLFQVGFGFSPLKAGGLLLAYFAGNLAMKSVTTRMLRAFGFQRILIVNGVTAASLVGAFAFVPFDPAVPLLAVLLFAAGLSRSMQFTALATLAFADVEGSRRGTASTLSSMSQQVSMVLGVAIPVAAIRIAQVLHGGPSEADTSAAASLADLRVGFLVVAAIGVAAALRWLGLPVEAGAEVSGHRGSGFRSPAVPPRPQPVS